MESQVTISKKFELLYDSGVELSEEFAKEQSALQKQMEKVKKKRGWQGQGELTVKIIEFGKQAREDEQAEPEESEEGLEERVSKATKFDLSYQRWYSITLALMKQHAPDRLAEFQAYYQPQPKRNGVDGANYVIQDWFRIRGFDAGASGQPWAAASRCFVNQLSILKSVKDRLEFQALSTDDQVERVLQLDLLKTARDLIKISERTAGALAGTVLATYLRKLAAKHELKLRKQEPLLSELADALKAARVLDVPAWGQVTWLADLRGRCLKAEGEAPTKLQVRDLVDGTQWLITNVF